MMKTVRATYQAKIEPFEYTNRSDSVKIAIRTEICQTKKSGFTGYPISSILWQRGGWKEGV